MLRTRPEWEDFLEKRKDKIRIFGILMGMGCALIVLRLWHLQVIEHSALAGKAESNRMRQVTIEGRRGPILDRSGLPLVDTRPSFQLSVIPEDTPDMKATLDYLAGRIPLDTGSAMAKLRAARPFEAAPLARDMDRETVAFIEERRLELPGVTLEVKQARNYIHKDFAAHLFGYLGSITQEALSAAGDEYEMGDFVGQTGVEKMFEASLRGAKGRKTVEVDAAGRELMILQTEPSKPGEALRLTLDFDAQKAAEEAFEGRRGAAVAMDPATGAILAFVSKPSFDPNIFATGISPKRWNALAADPFHPLQNRALMGQYPPGSTFKLVMALAALEEKIITPDTHVNCPGYYMFGGRSFRCWKKSGHGAVNLSRAIVESCDVYFYTVGSRLGIDKIAEYSRRMGLGVKTNVGLGGEKTGLIPSERWKAANYKEPWRPGETISCSIGQGYVLATPLQLSRMAAILANGGRFVVPTVTDGAKAAIEPVQISPESIAAVREAMRQVVASPQGTAYRLSAGPYSYAGKTGTAQVVAMKETQPTKQEDLPEILRDHALFVAFAPFDDPKIAVAVVAENAGHGGEVAAPIARRIMDAYLAKFPEIKPVVRTRPIYVKPAEPEVPDPQPLEPLVVEPGIPESPAPTAVVEPRIGGGR